MEHQPAQNKKDKKKLYIIVGFIVVLLITGGLFFMRSGSQEVKEKPVKKNMIPKNEVIPTVDPSVKVSVKKGSSSKKFNLIIAGVPEGTSSLEYVVTYETKDGGLPGISGTVDVADKNGNFEKNDILLGTCSSGGACVYHELAGPLNVVVKFTGSYGERISENAFEL